MANIYITEQGAVVRKDHGRIKVVKSGETIFPRPLKDISTLIVFGAVQLTSQAMLALLEEFRAPLVDRLVLRIFNTGVLTEDDFELNSGQEQCYLKKGAISIFCSCFKLLSYIHIGQFCSRIVAICFQSRLNILKTLQYQHLLFSTSFRNCTIFVLLSFYTLIL